MNVLKYAIDMEKEAEAALLHHLEMGNDPAILCNSCKELSNHIIELVSNEQLEQLSYCMARILEIYKTSKKSFVITSIENVFIYHVGSHFLLLDHKYPIENILPEHFCEILRRQMIGSNI